MPTSPQRPNQEHIGKDELRGILKQTPLYSKVDDAIIDTIMRAAHVEEFRRAEVIFLQGEPVTRCFVVLDGWVKLCRVTQSGDEVLVSMFTKAQSFAEAAAFMQGSYPASAEAVTSVSVLCIPTRVLIGQIRENPQVGLALLASISAHMHGLVEEIERLKANTGVERVAEFIMSLCPAHGGECEIQLPYDKALIAARLGMKPETLSRAFARLRDVGVNMGDGTAVIADVGRLRHYVLAGEGPLEGA